MSYNEEGVRRLNILIAVVAVAGALTLSAAFWIMGKRMTQLGSNNDVTVASTEYKLEE